MIPIEKLLFDIDQKLNRNANLKGQYIPDETKIQVLNIAQDKLVLKKVGINNNYQLGVDSFTKRYQDLQVLMVQPEKQAVTKVTGDLLNSYSMPIASLTNKMVIPMQAYVTATKGKCIDSILDITVFVRHEDIKQYLNSPYYTPKFEYQETIGVISGGLIYVYGDSDNTFTIDNLYLSYLRYPVQMDIAGYIHLDGTSSATVDCELEEYLENELTELAVEELADSTGNNEQSQLSRTRTKEAE